MDHQLRQNVIKALREALAPLRPGSHDLKEGTHIPLQADTILEIEYAGEKSRFLAIFKTSLYPSQLTQLAWWLTGVVKHGEFLPFVYGDYIGKVAAEKLREQDVSYLDGAGNCMMRGRNFFVSAEGKRRALPGVERTRTISSIASLKSSRVVRFLLANEVGRPYGVREISHSVGVNPGYASVVLQYLAREGYLHRSSSGNYALADPASLLDRWVAVSKRMWRKPLVFRAFTESADKLIGMLTKAAQGLNARYAMTLWSAVNAFSWSTVTETAAFYADSPESLLEAADFEYEVAERGENLWLMQPRDEGVYYGSKEVAGVRCVHPVQLYYDLSFAPHRGKALAEKVREELLGF